MKTGPITLIVFVYGDEEERDAEVAWTGPKADLVRSPEYGVICKACLEETEKRTRARNSEEDKFWGGELSLRLSRIEWKSPSLCDTCLLDQTISDMGLSYVLDAVGAKLEMNGFLEIVVRMQWHSATTNSPFVPDDDAWEEWSVDTVRWYQKLPCEFEELIKKRKEEVERFEAEEAQ